MTHARAYYKRRQQARQKCPQHAKRRRLERGRKPLQREQPRAQRQLQALEQALGIDQNISKLVVMQLFSGSNTSYWILASPCASLGAYLGSAVEP